LNNCARFESDTEVTIRFDSKFRIFAQHYCLDDVDVCGCLAVPMTLKPSLKSKMDELFLLWLSEPETQSLLRNSLRQIVRGEPVTRPASQLLVKPGNGGSGRQQAPKSPRIRPSSPTHLPTNMPSPRNRTRYMLHVRSLCVWSLCHSNSSSSCASGQIKPPVVPLRGVAWKQFVLHGTCWYYRYYAERNVEGV